ncbi:hypothetical protein Tco_0161994 [Tanacetum coccineum]
MARSSSQPTSTYEAAASLSEFKLTKILIDKMEKNKSYDKADYKNKLYDALVESYNTDKDIFDSYGKVFSLKRSRDDSDKDRDPSVGLDRGKKRRKSSKDDESFKDSRLKEKKSSSTSKDTSQSQHKSSGKSAHAKEPSHTVEDSGMQQDQEFVTGDNNEQLADKEVTKADWFKKPERPLIRSDYTLQYNKISNIYTPISTASPSNVFSDSGPDLNNNDQDDSQIPALEDIYNNLSDGIFTNASYDDEGAVADFTNLVTIVNVSPIPTSRIHSIHPATQILRDPTSAVQTRSKIKPKKISQALEDES